MEKTLTDNPRMCYAILSIIVLDPVGRDLPTRYTSQMSLTSHYRSAGSFLEDNTASEMA